MTDDLVARIRRMLIFSMFATLVVNSTMAQCSGIPNCPSTCKCFYVFPNELDNPPTYTPVLSNQDEYSQLAVSCQRQQLTLIPKGIPAATVVLFLAYNHLEYLESSMFEGLENVRTLDVSHNRIERIGNDTFYRMKRLEYVNIAYNYIEELPEGFLCPWYQEHTFPHNNKLPCKGQEMAKSVVSLSMVQNPWHCNCALQELIEHLACKSGGSPCVEFLKVSDSIGECHTPEILKGASILRLSSKGAEGTHNVCQSRNHLDIPMFLTMFAWFGGVIVYVIYFIRWNQQEMANQTSYLASLDTKPQQSAEIRPESHVEGETTRRTDEADSMCVRTSGQGQDRHRKLRRSGGYAVTRQSVASDQRSTLPQQNDRLWPYVLPFPLAHAIE